jgi:ADP-heptose:LPS heptosyltransferase
MKYKNTYSLPFRFDIPNSSESFLKKRSLLGSKIKFLKRYLYLKFNHQIILEVPNILPQHNKILWINISAPSIGDSLMDLSSRVMLNDRTIDLFTDKKNADIYNYDNYFSSVFTELKNMSQKKYDLVIIDSYSTRSIRIKVQLASKVPYVGMFGFYNGPDVNRILFSYHQMNKLTGYKKEGVDLISLAKPSITISDYDQEFIKRLKLPKNFIAIAIGGEWSFRKFNQWILVIEKLLKLDNDMKIILIGSDNAKQIENEILDKFSTNNVFSFISLLTYNQTAEIICKSNVLFCCDGGLMHAANAFNTKIIVLFARVRPEMRLTNLSKAFSLYDLYDVNNISVEDIMHKYNEAITYDHNHPLS